MHESEQRTLSRVLITLALSVLVFFALRWCFHFVQSKEIPRLLGALIAVVAGVAGVWALYWIANEWVSLIPSRRVREALLPFVFLGPALFLLVVYLVYPGLTTIYISFFDKRSENFVGLDNYAFIFTDPNVRIAFRNNAQWLIVVTSLCVTLGLLTAVLFDRIRLESLAKSFIFLPMAISAVGASVIWRFVYAWQPPGRPQIGVLNAIRVALGQEPVGWYIQPPSNNLALMAIMIWLQTGFCMVILSAALKNVPDELLEAARMDGANELQLFFLISVPYIRGVIITVATTVLIAVLKVFDIVYVMTRGNYDTEVIANRMYVEMYRFVNFGHGSALAVILFLAVAPAAFFNVRNMRRQRGEQ
ncbi:MAG: sugar ABC transporter permease [Anaerolineae bacterium]|nr:sugar ABC transporter permease [Anaerolineae bacterium]